MMIKLALMAMVMAVGACSFGLSHSTKSASAIFIMGDSSVDCGENTLFNPLIPHNLSFFPCDSGSDSSLLPYLLGEMMGVPRPASFYNQNGTVEALLSGLNFGANGASILRSPDNHQCLHHQLRQVSDTIQLLNLQLGPSPASHFLSSSLFFLSFGQTDFLRFLHHRRLPDSSSAVAATHRGEATLSQILADEMRRAMRELHDANVRKIVCMGILPLGCAPGAVFNWYPTNAHKNETGLCVDEINRMIIEYNQALKDHIVALNKEFPDGRFVYCDVYQGIMQIIANSRQYGLEDKRDACCGRGWRGAATGCLSLDMACAEPETRLWWDLYNPSEAVNSLLADSVWSGQPFSNMCHPVTVEGLVDAS